MTLNDSYALYCIIAYILSISLGLIVARTQLWKLHTRATRATVLST